MPALAGGKFHTVKDTDLDWAAWLSDSEVRQRYAAVQAAHAAATGEGAVGGAVPEVELVGGVEPPEDSRRETTRRRLRQKTTSDPPDPVGADAPRRRKVDHMLI